MVESLSIPMKWGIMFSSSMLLWIVPVSIRAARIVTFTSFFCSIAGFAGAAKLANDWKEEAKGDRRRYLLDDELQTFQLGLEEESIKQQLMLQYFPPEPQPIEQPQAEEKQPLSLPSAEVDPAIEFFLNWLLKREQPLASIRDVQRAKIKGLSHYKSADIAQLFEKAVADGHGIVDDGIFYHKSLLVG